MSWAPDVPGRGAWTLRGGLVNNSGGVTGYYQLPTEGQDAPGLARTGDSAWCVHRSVAAVQQLLDKRLAPADPLAATGVWDGRTQELMAAWQESLGLEPANGIFGPRTAAWFWRPQMTAAGRLTGVSWRFLYGLTSRESGFDPAAVGVNGYDHGLVQVNLAPDAHGSSVTRVQAVDPRWCYGFAARGLRSVFERWSGRTSADPWDVAIASHNSPALAQEWGETGQAPVVEGRIFQIADYVIDVRARGEAA